MLSRTGGRVMTPRPSRSLTVMTPSCPGRFNDRQRALSIIKSIRTGVSSRPRSGSATWLVKKPAASYRFFTLISSLAFLIAKAGKSRGLGIVR